LEKILGIALILAAASAMADKIDKRQVLYLTEVQRHHVLTEMRALLAGTQDILEALSREDMASVESYARPLGTNMTHKAEGHLKAVLPRKFMQLGMSTHKAFDQLADDAKSLADPKHTLRQLSESMKTCVACHAGYQILINERASQMEAQPSHHKH